jgi:hypothetical protein
MAVKLPSFFELYTVKDLIRLAKDNDGGYLVTGPSVLKAAVLVSLGINDDWSFERDFISLDFFFKTQWRFLILSFSFVTNFVILKNLLV